jgi:hypothetical protein
LRTDELETLAKLHRKKGEKAGRQTNISESVLPCMRHIRWESLVGIDAASAE